MPELDIYELGTVPYREALRIQELFLEKRINNEINDSLILLQHPPTFTTGKRGDPANLLASEKKLKELGIDLEIISRGGDITFHGPGQIVGYPVIDLNNFGKDIHRYLRALEKVLILTLKDFDIEAKTISKLTGVWVKRSKIASIGVGVRRWVTYHGFALNVNTNLDYFDLIIPCGIQNIRITSIKDWLKANSEIDIQEVIENVKKNFQSEFQFSKSNIKEMNNLQKTFQT